MQRLMLKSALYWNKKMCIRWNIIKKAPRSKIGRQLWKEIMGREAADR